MTNRHPEGPNAPQAQRARLLRRAIDGTGIGAQARFAARVGVSQTLVVRALAAVAIAGAALYFWAMWTRIRPVGSHLREAQGERF